MFSTIRIMLTSGERIIAVPKAALLSDGGTDFVFTHLKDDYYVRRQVTKGRDFDEQVEILAGLKAGETIVTEGAFLLKSDVLREKMGAGCAD
jgi:cobalt-zinc-cadmium efflux system membrane fusion protein